jgi:uncharacterized protein YaaQ
MTKPKPIDRVAILTLQGDTVDALTSRLTQDGLCVTIVESRGGFLSEPTSSLLVGFAHDNLPMLLEHFQTICHTRKRMIPVQPDGTLMPTLPMMIEAETCGATLYAVNVERFIQL